MKRDFLNGISPEGKREFLSKLQSGKYSLRKVYEPVKLLTFDLQESGLYRCKETGEVMTRAEVESLKGYREDLQVVNDRDQVAGSEPPAAIVKLPYTEVEYLNSLLVSNEPDKPTDAT